MEKLSCPYHYFCDSIYAGDYPAAVDFLVLAFTVAAYMSTLSTMVAYTSSRPSQRLLLPSGPVSLPVFLLILAKGHRINAAFPLFLLGPAILNLVYISALSFESGADKDIKYVFLEASTMSGILHASLNLDSVILPYYTGLDALVGSTLSGGCPSCVCRDEALVVGGRLLSYRGWSRTTFVVVCALGARIVCRLSGEKATTKFGGVLRLLLEGLGWVLITLDSVYLSRNSLLEGAVYGGIFALVFVHVIKLVLRRWRRVCGGNEELEKV
ncbi:uncharacterized protein LOC111025312 [Momordica charantia]|uniref:Uncharacterized protein LOC111025312 n=1 Tax=Momordica charantia TaxID=3673 RepID=A0A6J1E258_MOMCH|nr:uncharacterized protein LOC111025312 [Momordica charantia]